jgi:hypothetical protein
MVTISTQSILGHPAQFQVCHWVEPETNACVGSGLVKNLAMAVAQSSDVQKDFIL